MDLFDSILANSIEGSENAGTQYGIVADVNDPLGLGRVKVYDQSKGGRYSSDWLIRVLPFTSFTPPVPQVGELVAIAYINNDPHKGVYFGAVVNNVNRPVGRDKDITITLKSATIIIDGDTGNIDISTSTDVSVKGNKVTVEALDTVTIKSTKVVIDSAEVNLVNTTSFKVNGKQVATVGAVDSNSDVLATRGW